MRWSNLTSETDERARLPGYREEATVRHFDAPEALETRFYEVRAKSILNRVPEASRMPFRWTINPYRGCSHACAYCIWGDTPVLLGDGRHKPIADLEVGERIYGTVRHGLDRRCVQTTVLDKWITAKPAYRVVLADGTELIASGDHRFLSDRGWKHVVNSPRGQPDRPHLTTCTNLIGTGGFAPQPVETPDYRRGYSRGMVRGDVLLGSYSYELAGRKNTDEHRFRLALTDIEALRRARAYLQEEEVATTERVLRLATGTRREVSCIVASRRQPVERVRDLMEWPVLPSLDWCRGFLAGLSDAEGSRIDPSITRKRSIEGQMVKSFANLQVAAIEPLDQVMPLYDITTGTGDFIAGGVVSHNCFARPTHTYLDFDAGRDFEREIVVKVNAPELLRAELTRPSWKHEHVALGTNTDPYQWVEGRYKLMPGIWEAMRDAGNPCSVLTKSPLLLRDLSLMQEISARTDFSAALSVPTLDERAWRATEPHTPNPRARLEAVAELTRAGIRTGILVAPLMPGVNDAPEQVAAILEMASEAGAAYVTGIALHLRGEVRGLFFEWLEEHRPDLVPRYKELYRRGAYAPPEERRRLAALVKGPDLPPGQRMRGSTGHPPARAAPVHEPDQRSLF